MAPNGLRRIAEEICKNRTKYIDSTDELRKVLEGIYKMCIRDRQRPAGSAAVSEQRPREPGLGA